MAYSIETLGDIIKEYAQKQKLISEQVKLLKKKLKSESPVVIENFKLPKSSSLAKKTSVIQKSSVKLK